MIKGLTIDGDEYLLENIKRIMRPCACCGTMTPTDEYLATNTRGTVIFKIGELKR